MCKNLVSKVWVAVMYLAAMFQRQGRQLAAVFGLAMAIFNFISNLFWQRRTIMYSENTTRNRQGRQAVVIFGLALAMILVMGSMTVSYGWLSVNYVSSTEAELNFSVHYEKIKIFRDGTLILERNADEHLPMSGTIEDRFSKGVLQYKAEHYYCEKRSETPPYECIRYGTAPSSDVLSIDGHTYGVVSKNRTLSGENKIKVLEVCNGVQLTIKDADLSSPYGGANIIPMQCKSTEPPKVVIDNSTLTNATISGIGDMSDSGDSIIKTIPMELSVTNSRLNFPISAVSYASYIRYVILTKFSGNTSTKNYAPGYWSFIEAIINGGIIIENNQLPNLVFTFVSKEGSSVLFRKNDFNGICNDPGNLESLILGGNITIADNSIGYNGIGIGPNDPCKFDNGSVIIKNNIGYGILHDVMGKAVRTAFRAGRLGKNVSLDVYENTAGSISVLGYKDGLDCSQKPTNKIVRKNTVHTGHYFTGIIAGCGVRVENNIITSPDKTCCADDYGISVTGGYNEIIGNRVSDFYQGLSLSGSNNLIRDNVFRVSQEAANVYGRDNKIFNNIFASDFLFFRSNLIQYGLSGVSGTNIPNIWNTDKSSGPNIIGGPSIGGNYYSNWGGADANNDGFTDAPYVISDDPVLIQDNLPLYAPLVVNTATDEDDANLSDGRCDTDTSTSGDQCSLRAAIQTANARTGDDVIIFNIPGTPLIQVKKPLPAITGKVTINGNTQPGVEVNGASAGDGVNGLQISAADSKVMGLTIKGFSGNGIQVSSTGVILENVKCTDSVKNSGIRSDKDLTVSGITASGNSAYGIYLTGGNLTFSDTAPGINSVKDNKSGGIRVELGWVDAKKKIEVSGNGASKGAEGQGIYAADTTGADDGFAVNFSDGGVVSQNAGNGIFAQGRVKLDGTTITISENGYSGIYARNDIKVGTASSSGSSADISGN
ncbi:MAG: hypothetical protein BWK80_62080, partial [Desulfobacteraceae bacterium IS3]